MPAELNDPVDRAYRERVEKNPSMYKGAAGNGPYNANVFSDLEKFVLTSYKIDIEDSFHLDIITDHLMHKEAEKLPEIAKQIEISEEN